MPYTFSNSEFDSFQSNYDKKNWLDNKTWASKKIYDDEGFWLVIPNQRFNLRLGDTKPALVVFLRKQGEQFGDPITPLNIVDITAKFKVYDDSGNLITVGNASMTDADAGQFEYSFTALDFTEPGRFFGEFEFSVGSDVFTLPDNKVRLEIYVLD